MIVNKMDICTTKCKRPKIKFNCINLYVFEQTHEWNKGFLLQLPK